MTTNHDATTIVPAAPGWYLCEPVGDDGDPVADLGELEVIAWAITYTVGGGEPEGYALPVTADIGVVREPLVLRSPSGRYFRPFDCDFGTDRQAAVEAERARQAARFAHAA